jgi:cytochrome c5
MGFISQEREIAFILIAMKNVFRFPAGTILSLVFLSFLLIPTNVYSQKKSQEQTLAAFPENISAIFSESCVHCHSDQSSSTAKMFMNLSDWEKMKAKKQVKKGKKINKMVSKGAMPPKGFLEKHPDAILTPEQKKTISDWAKSLSKN